MKRRTNKRRRDWARAWASPGPWKIDIEAYPYQQGLMDAMASNQRDVIGHYMMVGHAQLLGTEDLDIKRRFLGAGRVVTGPNFQQLPRERSASTKLLLEMLKDPDNVEVFRRGLEQWRMVGAEDFWKGPLGEPFRDNDNED